MTDVTVSLLLLVAKDGTPLHVKRDEWQALASREGGGE